MQPILRQALVWAVCAACGALGPQRAVAQSDWEITPSSRQALDRGLRWLARNQGAKGNWDSTELGLVSLGTLAFLADGHMSGRGEYGEAVEKSLDYVLRNAKPSGLLNVADEHHDMYNHGLSCFVLGQAFGMTGDPRLGPALDRALKLIANTQCEDGGWLYEAKRAKRGNDLSLAVMQAKALRSAVDSGLEVPPEVIELAIKSVREHYTPKGGAKRDRAKVDERAVPGQFTYQVGGGNATTAMAAAGVVCLQEFGQYDDWRIEKNMEVIAAAVKSMEAKPGSGDLPLDSYTMYYVGQAIYQRGGDSWRNLYPKLRDAIIAAQVKSPDSQVNGQWHDNRRVSGKPGDLYATSVGCFILAMPNRYLPILQEGRIDSLQRFGEP
ncbi:MAG TPA: squalene--hopene cyclase [Pirellulales bacterium]|nr:squalene--hopene cyclase [Pirellulales bacterium]